MQLGISGFFFFSRHRSVNTLGSAVGGIYFKVDFPGFITTRHHFLNQLASPKATCFEPIACFKLAIPPAH